jgi:type VI secretion system protein ImpK
MQFRQFCSELLRLREMVEQRYPLSAADAGGKQAAEALGDSFAGSGDTVAQNSSRKAASPIEEIRSSLLGLLEQQSQRSGDLGGALGFGLFREAEYVMAALADELLLNAHWSGRHNWRLLEQEIFQTHASGDLFFQKLDRLLAGNASSSRDLAMIYFQALSLDFRGRYRNDDPQGQLERYRRQLYFRVYHSLPADGARDPIFLETYDLSAVDREGRRLPNPHLWWLVLAGICTLWIFASTLLWHHVTFDIKQQIEEIRMYSRNAETTQR